MKIVTFLLLALITNALSAEPVPAYDARIKNIIGPTDKTRDLALIKKIEVTRHTMKDNLLHGNNEYKSITAQQLEQIMSNVVTKSEEFIPDIFTLTRNVTTIGKNTYIIINKPHGLKEGDKIKVFEKNKDDKIITVKQVIDSNQFAVEQVLDNEIFIYGKQVQDFRNIDFNALTILNISATQALQELVKQLIENNNQLVKENKKLAERVDDIEQLLAKEELPQ